MNLMTSLKQRINIQRVNLFFETLPDVLVKRKLAVILILLLSTVFMAIGSENVIIDESLTAYFRQDDPVKQAYDRFRNQFGGDEYVYLVYRAKDGDIFSQDSLAALKRLHHDLSDYRLSLPPGHPSPLDHIDEVKSLINVQYMEARESTLFSRNFIGERLPGSDQERESVRAKAKNHPDYPPSYLSLNSEFGGILIRTDFNARKLEPAVQETGDNASAFDSDDMFDDDSTSTGSTEVAPEDGPPALERTDMREYPKFMSAIREILEKQEHVDAFEFFSAGNPVLMDFFANAVVEDMERLLLLVLLLIVVILWILFRSFSAVIWPVVIVIMTILWVLGLVGWLEIPMSNMIQVIVFLALSVGIADSVHILSGYLFFRNQNLEHHAALRAVMKKSGLACLLTSATTAVGLMSLLLVPLKPIAMFGLFAAVAVILAFLFTVLLLPVLLDIWAPVPKQAGARKHHPIQYVLGKIESVGYQYSRTTLLAFALASVVLFWGLLQLKVDTDFVEVIKKGLPLRDAYTLIDDHMGGTGNMEIMVDLGKENALKDPEVLFAMQELQEFMEATFANQVLSTMSLVNVVKESYKALQEGDPSQYRIPSNPHVLEQVVFMFENANPKDRIRLVSDDYARARIGMRSINAGSIEAMEIMTATQKFIDQRFASLKQKYPDLSVTLTGNMALLAIMLDYLAWAQIKSFGLALVVISLTLFLVLGSWKAGLTSIFPNLFPVLTTFGLMGFFKIPLDADTLLVAPIIIGLAVDDTIHFMTHFRMGLHSTKSIAQATFKAIREAGQAISFTSLILASGFLVFLLSFHNGLSRFGIFAAIAILTALISDLFLLPALCRTLNLNFNRRSNS